MMRWVLVAAVAVPVAGALVAFTGDHDRGNAPAPEATAAADDGTTTMDATRPAVRSVGPVADASGTGTPAKATEARLPASALEAPVTRTVELPGEMAVVVREGGEEGVVLVRVDPGHQMTEVARGSAIPAVSIDAATPGASGTARVTFDRDAAKDLMIEVVESPSEVANAIFYRTDIETEDGVTTAQ